MKEPIFEGVCTALVTPFAEGGINYPLYDLLLERQIASGVAAVVVCGTTGESATMSDEEQIQLIAHTVHAADGKIKVIAGTGTNSTQHALDKSRAAQDAGADALLLVTPYYNKCSDDGLVQHFTTIADRVNLPVITYNVPSRTGVSMTPELYRTLSQHPRIIGVKEACSSVAQVSRTIAQCGTDFFVWTGNDDLIVPVCALGGKGVISVFSNLMPKETVEMVRACQRQDYKTAANLQQKYMDLIDALFCEVNPIPIKRALCLLGYPVGTGRLPLCPMSAASQSRLYSAMAHHGLI